MAPISTPSVPLPQAVCLEDLVCHALPKQLEILGVALGLLSRLLRIELAEVLLHGLCLRSLVLDGHAARPAEQNRTGHAVRAATLDTDAMPWTVEC